MTRLAMILATLVLVAVCGSAVLAAGVTARLNAPDSDDFWFRWHEVTDQDTRNLTGEVTEREPSVYVDGRSGSGLQSTSTVDGGSIFEKKSNSLSDHLITAVPEPSSLLVLGLGLALGGLGLYLRFR